MQKKHLQKIPGVDYILEQNEIKELKKNFSDEFIKYSIRTVLNEIRSHSKKQIEVPSVHEIVEHVVNFVETNNRPTLKRVINASGIVLHTNLGRAPLGQNIFEQIKPAIVGYSNLEFDLNTGRRGKRTDHVIELLKFLTGAESALIVNNNAAALSLVLRTFAEEKETIISRGELIEIGGSFRLPEIMEASVTKMLEVGTTNRTRLSDYKKAITNKTAIILKTHKSNYAIEGFTEEVGLKELSALSKKNKLLMVYDIGSGLLFDQEKKELMQEPVVKKSFAAGADIVTFSCDKLLGGPQAGIIAGKKKLLDKISKNPLMRTYRVDKLTIAILSAVLRSYIKSKDRVDLPIFNLLQRKKEDLEYLARRLKQEFDNLQLNAVIRESEAFSGGGSLPQVKLDSYSVTLIPPDNNKNFAKNIYRRLLTTEFPVLSILRKGEIHFDVFTIFENDIPTITKMVKSVV
jgi:L-seryl-tRNA(Ser) seleniumtransferase